VRVLQETAGFAPSLILSATYVVAGVAGAVTTVVFVRDDVTA
jgi:hypothetical protein